MFDLTVLPYFVFAFMAIPPFIFGYFKGWRSGLFTLGLTLIAGGILIGICAGIYESALWPLFKGLFIQSHNPAGLDVESLKEISKTSVVSISVGIALIPVMLIMWGIYMGFKKLLNKYMNPRIKKISKNEVNVSRKNLKLTRAGGVVINGAAGLIVASAAAGAVSTLVTPSAKSNAFNSMTNIFADGMTFGQGQYNENYQRMFEFVKSRKENDPTIAGFNNVFSMAQATTGQFGDMATLLTTFKAVDGYDEFIKETNLMAKDSKEISKALVKMLLNGSQISRDFHLVGFDSAHLDGVGTDISNNIIVEGVIDDSFKQLESFVNNQDSDIKWNKEGVAEALKEIYNKKYVEFEKSPYYQEWKHSGRLLEEAKAELTRRKNDLITTTATIATERSSQAADVQKFQGQYDAAQSAWSKITALIANIGKTAPDAIPTPPDASNAPWASTWIYVGDDGMDQDKGEIANNVSNFVPIATPMNQGSYKDMTDQEPIKNNAISDYNKKIQATNKADGVLNTLKGELDQLNSELRTLNRTLASNQDKLKNAETIIKAYPGEKQKLANQLADEQARNGQLSAKATIISGEISKLEGLRDDAQDATTKAQDDLDKANGNLNAENKKTSGLENSYNVADQDYTDAQADAKTKNQELATANAASDAADAKLAAAEKVQVAEQKQFDSLQKIHDEAAAKAAADKAGKTINVPPAPDRTKLQDAIDAVTKANGEQVQAAAAKIKAQAAKIAQDKVVAGKLADREAADNARKDNKNEISRLTKIRDGKQTLLDDKTREQRNAETNLRNKVTEQTNNNSDIKISDQNITSDQDSITRNDNEYKQAQNDKTEADHDIPLNNDDIKNKNSDISAKENEVAAQNTEVSRLRGISDAALVIQTREVNKYNNLKGIYVDDHQKLIDLEAQMPTFKSTATTLSGQINDANTQLRLDINHQRVLNNQIPSKSDASIAHQEDVLAHQDDLLVAALKLKDAEKALQEKRGNELIELITKLLS